MEFQLTPTFKKKLAKKSRESQAAIMKTIQKLDEDPRRPGLNVHKMQGVQGVCEAYVNDGDRVTFHYAADGHLVMRNHCGATLPSCGDQLRFGVGAGAQLGRHGVEE